jgi:membrane protein involved in colicin uptake
MEVLAAAAVAKKAAEMRIAEELTVVKVVEEVASVKVVADKAAAVKVAADKAVAEKVAVDKATTTKAAEEAMVKAVMDVAAMKTAGQGAAAVKTNVGPVGSGSSPSSVVGSKRAAALGDSTPPSKLFHYAWKPQYTEQLCSHLLFIYLN